MCQNVRVQKTPKILHVALNYPPPLIGGSIVYLNQLLSAVPPEQLTVVTVSKGDREAERKFDCERGHATVRLPLVFTYSTRLRWHEKIRFFATWLRALWLLIRRETTDVVTLENVFLLGILVRLICGLRGVPYVVFVFGEELSQALLSGNGIRNRLRYLVYGLVLKKAAKIISISRLTSEMALRFGVAPELITEICPPTSIPDHLPDDAAIMECRAKHNLVGKRVILSVGRLIRRKGHDKLLEAMPQVLAHVPDAVLVVAGTGPLEAELRQLAGHLEIDNCVRFVGRVDADELAALYAICELFVMPNRTLPNGDLEGYGIVFNEASAYGKPVIGGCSGGTVDAIVDTVTGFLVDGNDPDAIANTVIRVLKDRDLAHRLGQRGQEWLRAERAPQKAAEQFLAVCGSVLGNTE